MAAASHGSGATRAPRPLGFSCLLALAIDFWTFGPRLQTGVERAWTSPSDPGHNTAVRFPTLTCVVVYTQVSGAGGRRTVSSAGFSGFQTVAVSVCGLQKFSGLSDGSAGPRHLADSVVTGGRGHTGCKQGSPGSSSIGFSGCFEP